ncbi:hypothetical protein ALI144C_19130 [Actinosynnema sp. ALI-1.44]|uniref:CHAT domain-containing protein n=1 Tax=Actinosynnema sp. ALI-1.44 TaxID=1933779 RepID=UPI00097C207D|nr:CHAT domain-containing protein [Actinosynnema sp. ALI-1.44]ONI81450.1 hypothetical protein ALI144C_19130 [Actinosynnema sp. ALI-1.44]
MSERRIDIAIVERIRRCLETDDATEVLAVDALVEAARMVLPAVGTDLSPEVSYQVAWLHWLRHCALLPDSDGTDITICLNLFGPLADSPVELPPPVRSWFDENPGPRMTLAELGPFYATVAATAALATADPALTDLGIDLCRAAARVCAAADRPVHLFNLMILLHQRYELAFGGPDLDEAVALGRELSGIADDRIALAVRFRLGLALVARFGFGGRHPDLSEGTDLLREAAAALPPGSPDRAICLSQLASALLAHCGLGAPLAVVDECAEVTRDFVDGCAEDDPVLGNALVQRCNALRFRYIRVADAADITESVRCGRAAVEMIPVDDELHATALVSLASALHTRFARARAFGPAGTADPADLAEAVDLAQAADRAVPAAHPLRWEVDAVLASVLRADNTDPAGAVQAARATLANFPADSPLRGTALFSLGDALRVQYAQTGDQDVLKEAVAVMRAARAADATGPLGRSPALAALSMVLYETIKLAGADGVVAEADFDEAIETTRIVAEDPAVEPLIRGQQFWQLAELLWWRFHRTDHDSYLDDRIDVLRTTVPLAPDAAARSACLSALAVALHLRYGRTWESADLDECIAAWYGAIDALAADDPQLPGFQSDAALCLLQRAETTGGLADIAKATELIRSALGTAGPDHPDHHRMLGVLGAAASAAGVAAGDVGKLTEAIETCRAATPPDSVPSVFVSLTLGTALMARYESGGNRADLDAAARTLQDALVHAAGPARSPVVNTLVLVLRHRFQQQGDLTDLTEGIAAGEAALREFPAASPDSLVLAANVAALRTDYYELVRDPADIAQAVDTLRSVISRTDAANRILPTFQYYLGNALRVRFQTTAQPEDLDEASVVLRSAIAAAKTGDMRLLFGATLGVVLSQRGQWSNDPADLAEATELLRAARAELPATHTAQGSAGMFLAGALRLRFVDSGEMPLLAEAIEIARDLIGSTPDSHVNASSALMLLGLLQVLRFERTGDIADLTEAIDALRGAVDAAGTNRTVVGAALPELANALSARHGRRPGSGDLDEAIAVAERAVALPDVSPTERGAGIMALATGLLARSMRTGDPQDLNTAIDLAGEAVRIPNWHVANAVNLMTLGLALWVRYDRTGAVDDLNAAIDALYQASASATPGHMTRPAMLTNLSNALRARAGLLGSLADLDAAVETGRSAVAAAPAGHPSELVCLMNLGTALLVRSLENSDAADLDAAIAAVSDAVERSAEDSPNRTELLLNLAGLLRARRDRNAGDLDRAVALGRAAIAGTDRTHPMFPLCALNLSTALRTRYSSGGPETDAAESIELAERAISSFAAAGDPKAAMAWLTLGQVHERRHAGHEGQSDLDTAVRAYRSAAESPAAAPMIRAAAARMWAELSVRRRDWVGATDAFGVTVALLPQVAWHGVERTARERRLEMWDGLAREAAAAALSAGDPNRAVELLEQGRSVLWSQALQTRDDLSALRDRDPALHDLLRAVAAKLAEGSASDLPDPSPTVDPWNNRSRDDQHDRIKLAGDWDRLLAEARALPGLEYLLRIPPLAALRTGLPDGPVVLLNVDATRCDALIVRRDQDVVHVPLPGLSQHEATERAGEYLRALRVLDSPDGPGGLATTSARQTLHATLEWLWDTVASPVLSQLEYTGNVEPLPRLWWCPTGSLALLPLHAAGYHDAADTPAGRTVIDRAVSSYTPTLRALTRANTAPAIDPAEGRVLVVSMPETPPTQEFPALSPLPGARAEAEFFAQALPLKHTLRIADGATREAVTADLRVHAYAHFACHGGQNLRQPSTGALYLRDHALTVLDVAELDLTQAELAYLSACSTAIGGTALPDEAIHLAAALQLAGYRHVVATLWTITDHTAVEVMTTMYTGLLGPAGMRLDRTARLLHRATRALRDSFRRNPARWASYIHFGP